MAVVTKYGNGYKDPAAIRTVAAVFAEGQQRVITSVLPIASGDSANSVLYIGKVPSNAIIDPDSRYYFTAITGLTDLDIGFANAPAALVDGDDLATAGSQTLAGHGTLTPANMAKRAWELAGLTADPGGNLDVFATMKAAAAAGGTLAVKLKFAK